MFKKLIMVVTLFIMVITAKAGDQKIESKIQNVIVFLNGAQVTRKATVNISPGISTLSFENISPGIDVQSIQLHANGEFTILSVKHEFDYLSDPVKEKRIEDLKMQQKSIKDNLALKNGLLSIYAEQAEMLRKNEAIGSQTAGVDILKLKLALDFQTDRLTDLKKKELALNNEIETLNTELQKYNQQIADITRGISTTSSNILVTVSSASALQSDFTLSYLVLNAKWVPLYDIRAKNINSPINISYKANITQLSGEDWKNVQLTLSTGNPSVNGIKPELDPYYLNLSPIHSSDSQLNEVVVIGYGTKRKEDSDDTVADKPKVMIRGVSTLPVQVNQKENQTNVEFNIANLFSVPSDGKQYTVEIDQHNINASYEYAVTPKLSTSVFLTAKLTDWNKYNFLPGEANLFFEGTFIGKSVINTQSTADTLSISLGADKNIVVTRTSVKELTERQSLGSNKKETRDWQIEIKNRKNQAINLVVEDQVPVSQNSSIDVETQELSGGELDKLTGKILWKMPLKAQENKKIELKYQVKYPKNQLVVVQ